MKFYHKTSNFNRKVNKAAGSADEITMPFLFLLQEKQIKNFFFFFRRLRTRILKATQFLQYNN